MCFLSPGRPMPGPFQANVRRPVPPRNRERLPMFCPRPPHLSAVAARYPRPADRRARAVADSPAAVVSMWAVLHASWMHSHADKAITVIIEEAALAPVAPLLMAACGLTDREQTTSGLVCQAGRPGRSRTICT